MVLDVDDTLYLERDYVRSGFGVVDRWASATLGVDGVGELAWDLFEKGVRKTTITDALMAKDVEISESLVRSVLKVYRTHLPSITMLGDARRFVHRLGSGPRLGVLTDGPTESQDAKCRALGLFDLADPVILSSDHNTMKPDPLLFDLFSDQWGLAGSSCVYVADNPLKDFTSLESLGWAGCRVRRPGSLHEAVATPRGIAEVMSLDELEV